MILYYIRIYKLEKVVIFSKSGGWNLVISQQIYIHVVCCHVQLPHHLTETNTSSERELATVSRAGVRTMVGSHRSAVKDTVTIHSQNSRGLPCRKLEELLATMKEKNIFARKWNVRPSCPSICFSKHRAQWIHVISWMIIHHILVTYDGTIFDSTLLTYDGSE